DCHEFCLVLIAQPESFKGKSSHPVRVIAHQLVRRIDRNEAVGHTVRIFNPKLRAQDDGQRSRGVDLSLVDPIRPSTRSRFALETYPEEARAEIHVEALGITPD